MAIGHISVRAHSRGKGHSAAAAIAYRCGLDLRDPRTNTVHRYARRTSAGSITATGIVRAGADAGAGVQPVDADGAQRFAEMIESRERRKDATLLRDVRPAMPHELTRAQRERLGEQFAFAIAQRYDTDVLYALHTPSRAGDERNHHGHFVVPDRDRNGNKIKVLTHRATGPEEVKQIRSLWERLANAALVEAGRAPTVNTGRSAHAPQPTLGQGPTADERRAARVRAKERDESVRRMSAAELVMDGEPVTVRGQLLAEHIVAKREVEARIDAEAREALAREEAAESAHEVEIGPTTIIGPTVRVRAELGPDPGAPATPDPPAPARRAPERAAREQRREDGQGERERAGRRRRDPARRAAIDAARERRAREGPDDGGALAAALAKPLADDTPARAQVRDTDAAPTDAEAHRQLAEALAQPLAPEPARRAPHERASAPSSDIDTPEAHAELQAMLRGDTAPAPSAHEGAPAAVETRREPARPSATERRPGDMPTLREPSHPGAHERRPAGAEAAGEPSPPSAPEHAPTDVVTVRGSSPPSTHSGAEGHDTLDAEWAEFQRGRNPLLSEFEAPPPHTNADDAPTPTASGDERHARAGANLGAERGAGAALDRKRAEPRPIDTAPPGASPRAPSTAPAQPSAPATPTDAGPAGEPASRRAHRDAAADAGTQARSDTHVGRAPAVSERARHTEPARTLQRPSPPTPTGDEAAAHAMRARAFNEALDTHARLSLERLPSAVYLAGLSEAVARGKDLFRAPPPIGERAQPSAPTAPPAPAPTHTAAPAQSPADARAMLHQHAMDALARVPSAAPARTEQLAREVFAAMGQQRDGGRVWYGTGADSEAMAARPASAEETRALVNALVRPGAKGANQQGIEEAIHRARAERYKALNHPGRRTTRAVFEHGPFVRVPAQVAAAAAFDHTAQEIEQRTGGKPNVIAQWWDQSLAAIAARLVRAALPGERTVARRHGRTPQPARPAQQQRQRETAQQRDYTTMRAMLGLDALEAQQRAPLWDDYAPAGPVRGASEEVRAMRADPPPPAEVSRTLVNIAAASARPHTESFFDALERIAHQWLVDGDTDPAIAAARLAPPNGPLRSRTAATDAVNEIRATLDEIYYYGGESAQERMAQWRAKHAETTEAALRGALPAEIVEARNSAREGTLGRDDRER